jgi:aspartate-semialdehyde dehydrogenase
MTERKKFGYKVAIFDPISIHGKEMKRVLLERAFPFESVKLIGSEAMLGTLTDFDEEATFIKLADNETLEDTDLVFFCGNPEETKKFVSLYKKLDFFAFDLSRSMDESDDYRYFVDGVNTNDAEVYTGIYASPNPNSVLLTKTLSKIDKAFGLEKAAATVLTSVSEDGFDGISNLHKQTTDLLAFNSLADRQRVFNIFPSSSAYPLEVHRIAGEVEKLASLKPGSISLSFIEAPIFFGAVASIFIELKNAPGLGYSWKKLFTDKEGFRFEGDVSKGDPPVGPVEIADTDMLHIQVLSNDRKDGKGIWVWALADNIRLCSVINLVQVAERALKIVTR